jgi:hypothetical protein
MRNGPRPTSVKSTEICDGVKLEPATVGRRRRVIAEIADRSLSAASPSAAR